MKEHIEHLLDFQRVTVGSNLYELIEYYSSLNKDFGIISNSIYDNKEKWKYAGDLESKLFRIYYANESIIRISKGYQTNLRDQRIEIFDVFSVYSLSRQQIETFLTCYHLYFEGVSEDEREFRNLTYKLNGILRQLELVSHIVNTDKRKQGLLSEHEQVLSLLKESAIYKGADIDLRRKYENPKHALIEKKSVLMEKSGLGRIQQSWKLYSNYVHSEYISDRQYNVFFRDKTGLIESICTTLNSNCRLISKLIQLLSERFNYINQLYLELSETQKLRIDLWNRSSEALK
ncbi:hypothetical protein [Croceimicrobium hydrocarbonivorans]|uniref:Uncharacterized protein n=1 Tax=Croceimicrobium hydrocarbonivorans TaxID=2761580 RepID=A0A7H0VDY1_9FLAO|nr:hypothetical protein [Croceimicrobium hydrocarbonivorans]QNR23929.1 hypothetical protein H4K34_16375 [Croceimicrobium hydrocarbonivorans]